MQTTFLMCSLTAVLSVGLAQICQNCEGRDGRDRDPAYCDRYYDCHAGGNTTLRTCPAGTFFDDWRGCNFIGKVDCPQAACGVGNIGRRYPSGVCCNKYFQCGAEGIDTMLCPVGEVFNVAIASCVRSSSPVEECYVSGMHYCDADLRGPLATTCNIKPDPRGNPCFFMLGNTAMLLPQGTFWNAPVCALGRVPAGGQCDSFFESGVFSLAATCTPTFRATFDQSVTEVINERDNSQIFVYTLQQGAQLTNGALTFDPLQTPSFLYYYRFISNEFQENTAFRIRFRLQSSTTLGQTYDLLSNNYCPQCPETISITTRRASVSSQEVTATFVPTSGPVVVSSAIIDVVNRADLLEAVVIFGTSQVTGQLSRLDPVRTEDRPLRTVAMTAMTKIVGANISVNKCGLQLGRGPNSNFGGEIDDFAVYQYCQNINQVLRR